MFLLNDARKIMAKCKVYFFLRNGIFRNVISCVLPFHISNDIFLLEKKYKYIVEKIYIYSV